MQFRILVLALAAGLITFGIVNVPHMAVDTMPEFAPAQVEIQTEALGLSAVEVEQLITAPMEADLLNGVAWLDEIRSKSVPGLSSIELVFEPGTDLLRARQLVAERMTQAHALPNVSSPPLIMQPMSSTSRVVMVRMNSKELSGIEMSVLARWKIKPRLIGIPGVANVSIWGQREQQLQVEVTPTQLRDKGITLEQLIKTTGNAVWVSPLSFLEASTPGTGGFVESPNQRLGIQHVLPIRTPADLAKVSVEDTDPQLLLGDIAQVKVDHQPLIGDAVGADAGLMLVIEKFPGVSALEVTRRVEAALKDMEPGLTGVQIDTSVFRPATGVQDSVNSLGLALLISLLIAVALFWLLFRSWRVAVIALVAIATTVTTAAVVLFAQNATLNITVLIGVLLGTSVIVGDIVEDVQAHRRQRAVREATDAEATPRSRSSYIVRGVRTPLFHASLMMVVVLVPTLFVTGVGGSFLSPLFWSLALTLAAALIVGLSVTPVLAYFLLPSKTATDRELPAVGRGKAYYDRALGGVNSRKPLAIVAIVVVGILGVAAGSQLAGNRPLVPTMPDRTLLVQWDTMAGTSNDEVRRIAALASDELRALPGVSGVGGHVGRAISADQVVGNSSAELWVSIARDANFGETERAVRDVVQGYPGIAHNVLNYSQQTVGDMRSSLEPGFAVRVYGTEMPVLREKAEEVRQALQKIDGVNNPTIDAAAMTAIVEVQVNLEAAQKFGIKPGDARRAAATLMQGIVVGNLFEEQKVFEVVVRGAVGVRDDLTSIRELLLDAPNGGHVQLGQVADVRMVPSEVVIQHDATSRRIDVVADVSGRPLADIQRDIEAAIQQIQFPLEHHAEIPTKYSQLQAADTLVHGLGMAAILAVLLLLQTALRSWKLALAVFLTLPAAMAGAAVAAWIGAESLSWLSLTAFAAVVAIAARNAALLSARVDELWRESEQMSRTDLVMTAARDRISPILKSALITFLVLIPPAILGGAVGQTLIVPMLLILAGGLVTTTLVGIFVLPLLTLWFGPRTEPEEWSEVYESEVPVTPVMPEKVEVS
ncbi:efflux RND transporter permease subunit [Pseudarthrobacter raffinosi]|uniref:efflux RND transporter permease subunit n=1 Tax=Pseudarthrobacter raffinosi TaxID=2953651 RepID=UPI00208E9010|nr:MULTISPECIES: efflux RND transporter permease subunit [unclassified Pseudarthrobacter]MCO4236625.1 efflux RND transporter permease subunit [Pseudarthrobacter sp. MDT3-28]MCO4250090.1 efflux RND transporter permease subunit [Pseudarthrobacter sp. MDT3-9]